MAWAFVQGIDIDGTVAGTTGVSVAFATNPTPGNVIIAMSLTTIASPGTPTFTDTYGSAINVGGGTATPGATGVTMGTKAGLVASSSGTDTVKVVWGSATSGYVHLAFAEFSGVPGTLTGDGFNSAATTFSASPWSGATLTTTLSSDVLIEYMASNVTGGANTPWSILAATPHGGNASGYQINKAATSYQTSFTDTPTATDPNIIAAWGGAGAATLPPELVMAPPHR